MSGALRLAVEVAYAPSPDCQRVIALELPPAATVADAIRASGLLDEFPALALPGLAVGIFGERARLTDCLHGGERVEIYRPLLADPKQARRARAAGRRPAKR